MAGFSIVLLMMIVGIVVYAIILLGVILGTIGYVLESLALMEISKNLGYPRPATSWIPFYQKYKWGEIAKQKGFGIATMIADAVFIISIFGLFLIPNILVANICFWLMVFGCLASYILNLVLSYFIYVRVNTKISPLFVVLGAITGGFLRQVFLFAFRKKVIY